MAVGELQADSLSALEMQQEQDYFDAASAAREAAALSWDVSNWSAGTAAERRAFQRASESIKAVSLDDEVAFGRIDLDDEETTYYIGKAPIFDKDRNLLVLNWQAPAAAAYNQASARNPMGLVRKRQFDAPNNRIRSFEDTVFKNLAAAVAVLESGPTTDDALLLAMNRKRSGSMTDIVKTIQAAQDTVVRADKNQLLVVQGGPGTGKTAVALHRVSWLLFNYQDELPPQDVLVVGPNPTFTKYIRRVLPDLGDNDVVQRALQDLLAPGISLSGSESDAVASLKGSAVMADVLANALLDRIREPGEVVRIQRRNSGAFVEVSQTALKARLAELRSEVYLEGRSKLRQTLVELAADKMGLLSGATAVDFLDPRSLENAVERIWPQLSAQQFLRELLGSKDRLLKAARDMLKASEIELLYRPAAEKVSDEAWTFADLALLDEVTEILRGEPQLFGHIVIDEAQDLSDMQLMAIRRRSRTGSMTIVGDIAQSTGPYATDSWYRARTLLGSALPVQETVLEHGYRVPVEVFEIARPVLAAAAPNVQAPEIVRHANVSPQFSEVDTDSLPDELAKLVAHHSGRGRFVGVIAVEEQWPQIRAAFEAEEIQWSESTSGDLSNAINLVTPQESKGLEFDAVIVVDPQSILEMRRGDRFLYIALTRTTTRLDIIYPTGTLPVLLGGTADNGTGQPAAAVESGKPEETLDSNDAPESKHGTVWKSSSGGRKNTTVVPTELGALEQKMVENAAVLLMEQMASTVHPKLVAAVVGEMARIVDSRS